QLALEVAAAAFGERIQVGGVAASPGEEGDFVDGRDEGGLGELGTKHAPKGCGEPGEGGDPIGREDIEIVGPAEVEDVPDELDAMLLGGVDNSLGGGEIVFATDRLNEVPAQAFARGPHADFPEPGKILAGKAVVASGGYQVEASSGFQDMGGAFESGLPE